MKIEKEKKFITAKNKMTTHSYVKNGELQYNRLHDLETIKNMGTGGANMILDDLVSFDIDFGDKKYDNLKVSENNQKEILEKKLTNLLRKYNYKFLHLKTKKGFQLIFKNNGQFNKDISTPTLLFGLPVDYIKSKHSVAFVYDEKNAVRKFNPEFDFSSDELSPAPWFFQKLEKVHVYRDEYDKDSLRGSTRHTLLMRINMAMITQLKRCGEYDKLLNNKMEYLEFQEVNFDEAERTYKADKDLSHQLETHISVNNEKELKGEISLISDELMSKFAVKNPKTDDWNFSVPVIAENWFTPAHNEFNIRIYDGQTYLKSNDGVWYNDETKIKQMLNGFILRTTKSKYIDPKHINKLYEAILQTEGYPIIDRSIDKKWENILVTPTQTIYFGRQYPGGFKVVECKNKEFVLSQLRYSYKPELVNPYMEKYLSDLTNVSPKTNEDDEIKDMDVDYVNLSNGLKEDLITASATTLVDVPFKKFYLCVGVDHEKNITNDNGKSTFLNDILGDIWITESKLSPDVRNMGTSHYRTAYQNKKLVVVDELPENGKLPDIDFVKESSAKNLKHSVNPKGRPEYSTYLTPKFFFATNHGLKIIQKGLTGISNRLTVLAFPNEFPQDPSFTEKLKTPENLQYFIKIIIERLGQLYLNNLCFNSNAFNARVANDLILHSSLKNENIVLITRAIFEIQQERLSDEKYSDRIPKGQFIKILNEYLRDQSRMGIWANALTTTSFSASNIQLNKHVMKDGIKMLIKQGLLVEKVDRIYGRVLFLPEADLLDVDENDLKEMKQLLKDVKFKTKDEIKAENEKDEKWKIIMAANPYKK